MTSLWLILPVISAIGAYYQCRFTSYIAPCVIVGLLVAFYYKKVWNAIPIVIYCVSASLLLSTSMLGSHIIGNDIHGEFYVVQEAIKNGWDVAINNSNNTSLVLGWFSPLLSHVIPVVWQFKLIFPLFFSLTPVFLYYGFRKLFGERRAFLSCLFVMVMPMYTLDMTSHVKGMVAETFLAALLPLMVCDMKLKWRVIGLSIAVIGATVSHYTIGALSFIYLIGIVVVLIGLQWRSILHLKHRYIGVVLCVSAISLFSYYSLVGEGSMLSTLDRVGGNITRIIGITVKEEIGKITEEVPEIETYDPEQKYTDEELKGLYSKRTQPVEVTGTYLDDQEQMVRTALGIDFKEATGKGKVFRVIQLLTEILIGLGVVWALRNRKTIPLIYQALVITAFISLLACLFVPYLSTVVSATRFYQVALFFIAPAFIIGLEWVIKKRWLMSLIFVSYAVFTLGLVFEVTQENRVDVVNIPYSLSLSNYRMNFNGVYSEDDITVAKWLSYNADKEKTIMSDYNGLQLLTEYEPIGITRFTPEHSYYIFVTGWSYENGLYVYAKCPGLRMYQNLPDLSKAKEVYRMGNAVAYEVSIG